MSRPVEFGEHVRNLRRSRSLTQEQLAEASGLAVDTIRRIERGAFSPSLETLTRLAGGLEISLITLFDGVEKGRTKEMAELFDYLARRSPKELRIAQKILRALFAALSERHGARATQTSRA
jgi:transcriptional regulator with XRE-family HTH domain